MRLKVEFEGKTYRVPFRIWWMFFDGRSVVRKVRHVIMAPFAWTGILLGILILSNLPYRMMLAVCDFASVLYRWFDRNGRKKAEKNLAIMFPAAKFPSRGSRTIIKRSYRNMCRSVGYAFWTFRSARKRCVRAGSLADSAREFLAVNRPAVTVSGHLGCWEILSQLAFLEGHEMMSVAKDIGTSGMTRMLMRARRSIGQEIVPAEGAFKPLMAGIKSGKSLGLLVDQVVEPVDGGTYVKFFGSDYYVSPAPAFFAAKAHAPIIVAWSRPLADGRYRCEKLDEISAEDARDIRSTAQRIAIDLERVIRRHPSAWILNYDYFVSIWTKEQHEEFRNQSLAILRTAETMV